MEPGRGDSHSGQQELEEISNDSGAMSVILAGERERARQSPQEIQLINKCGARHKAELVSLDVTSS